MFRAHAATMSTFQVEDVNVEIHENSSRTFLQIYCIMKCIINALQKGCRLFSSKQEK